MNRPASSPTLLRTGVLKGRGPYPGRNIRHLLGRPWMGSTEESARTQLTLSGGSLKSQYGSNFPAALRCPALPFCLWLREPSPDQMGAEAGKTTVETEMSYCSDSRVGIGAACSFLPPRSVLQEVKNLLLRAGNMAWDRITVVLHQKVVIFHNSRRDREKEPQCMDIHGKHQLKGSLCQWSVQQITYKEVCISCCTPLYKSQLD